MNIDLAGLRSTNWFYISSILFTLSLPFSSAFISISASLLLLSGIVQFNWSEVRKGIRNKKGLFFLIGIYLVYVFWLLATDDWKWASYDLRKNMAYITIPIAFILGPSLTKKQVSTLLYIFAGGVMISSLITFGEYYLSKEETILSAQQYGFMHHIRFSLQIDFAIFILLHFLIARWNSIQVLFKLGVICLIIELLAFLIWHQSLTGILTLGGTLPIAIAMWVLKQPKLKVRLIAGLVLIGLIVTPILYLYKAVNHYYSFDEWAPEKLEKYTKSGNPYSHSTNKKIVENGHYIGLYVCEKEMEKAWNNRSNLKYKDRDQFGYEVKFTLIRYLSSKNLRKDAEGVAALSQEDIRNVQNGISNYILADKGISLYPRIYVSIWEIDTYLKTGQANHKSLAQRIEYSKAAIEIIKNNFWLGVGTGNWKKAYRDVYESNQVQMAEARYGNVHNQYLNYIVKFGLVGFAIIMFVLLYPVINTKAYRNELFLLFLVIMFIGNFGDANFETHTGSHFFVFFYCILILSNKTSLEAFPNQ